MAPSHNPLTLVLFLLFSCFLRNCQAATADLEITFFVVNGFFDKIPLGVDVPISPTIDFKNLGPDAILISSVPHYSIKAYFSNTGDPNTATYWQHVGPLLLSSYISDLFKSALPVGFSVGGTNSDAIISIPPVDCEYVEYLCLEVVFNNNAMYNDPNLDNNIACAQFGPRSEQKIGEIECYIDLQLTSLTVLSPLSLSYTPGLPSMLTVQTHIKNGGLHSIQEASAGQHNFAPRFYLTDGDTLATSTFNIIQSDPNVYFDMALLPDETILLPSFQGEIVVPLDHTLCTLVTHLCVEIMLVRPEYVDIIAGNEIQCLELIAVDQGGAGFKLGCPVDGLDIVMESFQVYEPSNILYDIGASITITMETTFTNLGSESIPESSTDSNYQFELVIIDHISDINLSSDSVLFFLDTSTATNLGAELIYGLPGVTVTPLVATITLPKLTSRCRAFQSMCLKVLPQLPYIDVDLSNNYHCLTFDNSNAGEKTCPELDVDILSANLDVSAAQDNYPIDQAVAASLSFTATNRGPGSIPAVIGSQNNFIIEAFLTNADNLENATIQIKIPNFNIQSDQLQQEFAISDTILFSTSSMQITIPSEYCDDISHICTKVTIPDSSLYTDIIPELADTCLAFEGSAGNIHCYIDLAATDLDLAVTYDLTYDPGYQQNIYLQLSVTNLGGLTLVESIDYNFKPTTYLTDSGQFESATVSIQQDDLGTTFNPRINGDSSVNLQEFPVSVTIPTVKSECESISYLCIMIDHNINHYTDIDSSNDDACIQFGEVSAGNAGTFSCNILVDLEVDNLAYTPTQDMYPFDTVVPADVTLRVTNRGFGQVPRARGSDVNFDVKTYLTNSGNFEDATVKIEQPNLDIDVVQLQQQLLSGIGEEIDLSFSVDILVPIQNCQSLSHICFIVTLHNEDNLVFYDDNSDNNDVCIEFGPIQESKAGKVLCFIDIAAIDLEIQLESSNTLTYEPGKPSQVMVQLTVTNYGGLDLTTAPSGTYNFGTQVFITNTDNLYTASVKTEQDPPEKIFMHEVGAGFIVILPIFAINITIPTDINCLNLKYLCLLLNHNVYRYIDRNSLNDFVCLEFGSVKAGKAGRLPCNGLPEPMTTPKPITQTPLIFETFRPANWSHGYGTGNFGRLETDGLALHYVMIITTLVFITVIVAAVVLIKYCRKK